MRQLFWIFLLALPAQSAVPVWIDTDPSVARGGHEVDDGLALIQAFHSRKLAIRGISVVFGNAPLKEGFPIAQHLVKDFGPRDLAVYPGAAGAAQFGVETEASSALAAALRREKLTILALGPVTNVATLIRNHPELVKRISRIIVVAGRRPNQKFSTVGSVPPFRDLNFELDSAAFQVLLDSGVPIVLVPWEISSKVWIKAEDLATLRSLNSSLGWVLDAATDWLDLWRRDLASDGFNPFDSLAIGYVDSSRGFRCDRLPARIEQHPDDTVASAVAPLKPYLYVGDIGTGSGVSRSSASAARVTYCHEAPPSFKPRLLQLLKRHD